MTTRAFALIGLLIATLVFAACGSPADKGPDLAATKDAVTAPQATAAEATPTTEVPMTEESSDPTDVVAGQAQVEKADAMKDGIDMVDPVGAEMTATAVTATPMADSEEQEAAVAAEQEPEEPASKEPMVEDPADGGQSTADAAFVDLPSWLTAELTDVNSGQTFAVADYRGKTVLVETLAVWCSNCLKQQRQVQALHGLLGERDDLVSVGLDIDLNESPAQLRKHAERNGFDWVYAVATPEVAREIGQLYGRNFLNPPSTPMLIVDRDGQVHPLPFGIKSAEALHEALSPFLAGKGQ